jgi:hypothetical protein
MEAAPLVWPAALDTGRGCWLPRSAAPRAAGWYRGRARRSQLPLRSRAGGCRVDDGAAAARRLRDTPCHDGPSDSCTSCGLCTVRRPEAVQHIVAEGASRIGAGLGTAQTPGDIAGMIDHTLLKADATAAEVEKLCQEARTYHFASVCVNTGFVPLAKRLLARLGRHGLRSGRLPARGDGTHRQGL